MSELIKVSNLSKSYKIKDGTVDALSNINLTIDESDIYGIIGLSGAGKSTLIRCINLLEKPTSGSIIFQNTDITKLKKKDLLLYRQKMGMIFQSFNLLQQRTVLKNVLFPLEIAKVEKNVAKEKAMELLKIVGLEDKINAYPSQLSGGQQQRVAIARALANDPNVLLCDEPTSALDPNTTTQILDLLKEINKNLGITIIIITHEMRVIETICNKVSIIDKSTIVETGYVKDVFMNPQSDIAKQLIIPETVRNSSSDVTRLRIVFDGNVYEPIIANMVLECKCFVSILSSNLKKDKDKAYGDMIIELPSNAKDKDNILKYLNKHNVIVSEVE